MSFSKEEMRRREDILLTLLSDSPCEGNSKFRITMQEKELLEIIRDSSNALITISVVDSEVISVVRHSKQESTEKLDLK